MEEEQDKADLDFLLLVGLQNKSEDLHKILILALNLNGKKLKH